MSISASLHAICDLLERETGLPAQAGLPSSAGKGLFVWPYRLPMTLIRYPIIDFPSGQVQIAFDSPLGIAEFTALFAAARLRPGLRSSWSRGRRSSMSNAACEDDMKISEARRYALSLPETSEEPHFHFSSFRVRGKIFATVPPEETHLHVFVDEVAREAALATHSAFVEKLLWGGRVRGLRVTLAHAKPSVVEHLLAQAWRHKAPKKLAATLGSTAASP